MTFKDEVKEYITECMKDKPMLRAYLFEKFPLKCDSGNLWKPDIIIVDRSTSKIPKLIGEIKQENYSYVNPREPKNPTHREHMWRAGARFCDVIRSYQVPKYLIFPYLNERSRGFDCYAYFENLDVALLDWGKEKDVERLTNQIYRL
jgi:hypothetical protein